MDNVRYFVFPAGQEWLVAMQGLPLARHESREQAVSSAIVMADLMGSMHHQTDVMVESDHGLETVWTYGRDPVEARSQELS